MAEVTVRMRPNGPLLIEGPFKLVDSRGAEFQIPPNKPAVALCRCGQSSK
jgi:CDGSH-type Zn-finger protein